MDEAPRPMLEPTPSPDSVKPSPLNAGPPHRFRLAAIVGLATLAWLVATEPRLAIVWDEGYTLGRVQRIRWWFSALVDPPTFAREWSPPPFELVQRDGPPPPGRAPISVPTPEQLDSRSKLFSAPVLLYFWPFAREEPHGHPPFYALVGLIGNLFLKGDVSLAPIRFGTMAAFALVNGFLFGFLDLRRGRWAAFAACGALALQPRLFAHAHYATYDALLTALWLLALMAFWLAVEPSPTDPDGQLNSSQSPRWRWVVLFGLVLGTAFATKLTGWMIPIPLAAWALLYRDRRALLTLLAAAPLAVLAALILIPPWWHDPLDGFSRFLASNLGRAQTIPIRTLFLGKLYNTPAESLPWYNTLAITAMVTPIGFLLLALTGAGATLVRTSTDRFGALVLLNWAFLLLLRALPNVPGHDVERLFLPAFGLLALAAGLGAGWLVSRSRILGGLVLTAALVEGIVSILLFLPVPLAYYSPLIGGPRGAEKLGMEPTYYWDALSPEVLAWINEHTPPGEKVAFATQPTSLLYLRSTDQLRPSFLPNDPGRFAFYVVQNRPGSMSAPDRRLVASGKPAYVFEKFGVPLVWVYPFSELEKVIEVPRTSSGPG